MINISVIIPTYNPDAERIRRTLAGLRAQTLPVQEWELLIIDNNSSNAVLTGIDLDWHPAAKIIAQPLQGLTHARLKGFLAANGGIIVMVDDDNILAADYLAEVLTIFKQQEKVGAIGGKSLPDFVIQPPRWAAEFYENLALRDLGETALVSSWNFEYPPSAPIGAGMALRAEAIQSYLSKLKQGKHMITDRQGDSLSSGGDNDLVMEVLQAGWLIGYFPSLVLRHIIPAKRLQAAYLARLINHTNRSWIEVLQRHKINPWGSIAAWTVPFRKVKAWFSYRAWIWPVNYIKWRGACGIYDGLAEKNKSKSVLNNP